MYVRRVCLTLDENWLKADFGSSSLWIADLMFNLAEEIQMGEQYLAEKKKYA